MSLYSKRNVSIATMFWQNCLFQIWFLFVCLFLNDDATIFFCFRHCCIDFVEFWVILDGFLTFFQQSSPFHAKFGHYYDLTRVMDEQTVSSVPTQIFNVASERSKCLEISEEKRWGKCNIFVLWVGLFKAKLSCPMISKNFAFNLKFCSHLVTDVFC